MIIKDKDGSKTVEVYNPDDDSLLFEATVKGFRIVGVSDEAFQPWVGEPFSKLNRSGYLGVRPKGKQNDE